MEKRYDIAIVGSGPAGLSAAINAKIRNKTFVVFGNNHLSYKLEKAPKINNYLGFFDISGEELKNKFISHLDKMDVLINDSKVNSVYSMGKYFILSSEDRLYEAKSVIIATGVEQSRLIDGENEFLGRGVGYCATCDAPLYRNKVVSIISYNKEYARDADFVSEIAKKVNYIPMYRGSYDLDEKIDVIQDKPIKIIGKDKVEKLVLKNNTLETDGVFLLKDSISPKNLVPGLKMIDNHIEVNRYMETNIKGCFAAGDCIGPPYQFIKAAGEGNVAALSAVKYLDQLITYN